MNTHLRHILLLTCLLNILYASAGEKLTPFLSEKNANTRIAIIICPGGSYSWLAYKTEGEDIAKWLQNNGINAFVLKYRVATVAAYITGFRVLGIGNKYPDMLTDVQNALRELYLNHDKWNIDTSKIGVMGFSAGGHLTMMSYLLNHTRFKPAFLCPIYPVVSMSDKCSHIRSRRGALGVWKQWNTPMRDSLSIEKHITADCPPTFIVHCKDDKTVNYRNSQLLDSALTANNVSHLLLLYEKGGHGFGVSKLKPDADSRNWPSEFLTWLHTIIQQPTVNHR